MTHITALVEADRVDWLPLWHAYLEFYEEELSEDQTELTFERVTDPDQAVHGAIARDDEGRAVGFVHWLTHVSTWSEGPYCYLEDLYVAPDARGGGVGRALIAFVTDWAGEAGCSQVYWLTQSHNATARVLYNKVADDTGFVHYSIDLGE
ncbi:MAG: GNAT family N-acetyltransferase [Microbacterium sp.]